MNEDKLKVEKNDHLVDLLLNFLLQSCNINTADSFTLR